MNAFVNWLKARLVEKSTLAGVAVIAASVYTGPYLAAVNALLPVILGVLGGGAVAATTKPEKEG